LIVMHAVQTIIYHYFFIAKKKVFIIKDDQTKQIINYMMEGLTRKEIADKTFMEVVHSSQEPSIYNIFRLFKIFYPKNNPNFKSGDEPGFVSDAKDRLGKMQDRTKGNKDKSGGYNEDGTRVIYNDQKDFWRDFAKMLPFSDIDEEGYPIEDKPENKKWQVSQVFIK